MTTSTGKPLTVLAARELTPTTDQRARIDACTDGATLDRWIARAVRANTIDEILAD